MSNILYPEFQAWPSPEVPRGRSWPILQAIRPYDRRYLGNPSYTWRTECRFRGCPGILEIFADAGGWRARFLQPAADGLRAGEPITQPDSFWRCLEEAAALVNLPLDAVLRVIQ